MNLTWHRYIYKTRLKRAIEKMEKLILEYWDAYMTAQVNLNFEHKVEELSYL